MQIGIQIGLGAGARAVAAQTVTLQRRIAVGADDGYAVGSAFSAVGAGVFVGDNTAANFDYVTFLRFQDVQLPQAAQIARARLYLTAQVLNTAIPQTRIRGELSPNPATITSAAMLAARSRTTSQVLWTPAEWEPGQTYSPPPITSVLQEIVNQATWAPGNALILFWEDPNTGWPGSQQRIGALAYETDPNASALLVVEYQP